MGLHPHTGPGVPRGDAIDDLAFLPNGELLVLVGSQLAKGRGFVPVSPPPSPVVPIWLYLCGGILFLVIAGSVSVLTLRSQALHVRLSEVPLSALPGAIRSLRWFRALERASSGLGLPVARMRVMEAMISDSIRSESRVRLLAGLLGMKHADEAPVEAIGDAVLLLAARFENPAPLRGGATIIVSIDRVKLHAAEIDNLRGALAASLEKLGPRFELPFLLPWGRQLRRRCDHS